MLSRYILPLALLTSCGVEDKRRRDCILDGVDCHAGKSDDTEGRNNNNGIPNKDWTGPRGAAGSAGRDGNQGNAGNDGSSCSVTQGIGSAEIHCTDGTSAVIRDGAAGISGADGSPGQAGVDGSDGEDGTPGTVITPVKLCPNHTTVYPSVFVEVAFCIDNKLYAVYSANGGFMTEIPPGNYHSNAIGSACNLTVLPNCIIQ